MRRPLKISIVGHGLRAGGGISVGHNFIASVTRAMPDAQYQIFVPANLDYERCVLDGVSVEWHSYYGSQGKIGRWAYDQFELPARISKFAPAVMICLGNVGVRTPIAPQVLLLQDSHYFYPKKHFAREDWHQHLMYRYKRLRLSRDLRNTQVLLCQTRTAVQRATQWYGFNKKVALLPNAVSRFTLAGTNADSEGKISALLKIGTNNQRKFRLFYLSRYYPHKNFEILLELFDRYRDQLDDVELYLTITDRQHAGARKLLAAIEEKGLSHRIINLGPIAQGDIAATFAGMDALVMPTLLESFSGTYIEAMAFGCPIITSDLDFAHEVCRDAALYFDPWSVQSLFEAIWKLLLDPHLAQMLREKGHLVSAAMHHSWEQNAQIIKGIVEGLTK